jgi:hypothetical protein
LRVNGERPPIGGHNDFGYGSDKAGLVWGCLVKVDEPALVIASMK